MKKSRYIEFFENTVTFLISGFMAATVIGSFYSIF
jgi:hypothetical protein